MTRRFLTPINVVRLASAPSSATQGDIYYNTGDNRIYVYNGSAWTLAGVQGIQGTIGSQGTTGIQGANGTQGLTGTQGTTGLQGLIGSQGTTGLQGIQGISGLEAYYYQATAPTVGVSAGATWIDSDTGIMYIYVNDGNSSQWIDVTGGYVGPTGPTGSQGTTGTQGTTGLQGTSGTQGTTGTQGLTGIQGLTGTQGTNGQIGAQGIQGTIGLTGPAGGVSLAQYTSNQTLTNTVTKTALVTYSLTQATGSVAYRIKATGEYLNNSGSNRTLAMEVALGASVAFTATTANLGTSATTRAFEMEVTVYCDSSTDQSVGARAIIGATVGAATWATNNQAFLGEATLAEDTSTAKSLEVRFTHSLAATTISLTLASITIERIGT